MNFIRYIPPICSVATAIFGTGKSRVAGLQPLAILDQRIQNMLLASGLTNCKFFQNPCCPTFFGDFYSTIEGCIVVDAAVLQADPNAGCFLIQHEIGHVLAKDCYWTNLLSALPAFTFSYFCLQKRPITAMCIAAGITHLTSLIYGRHREGRADDYAIQHATKEELLGGLRVFQAYGIIERHSGGSGFFKKSHIIFDVHPSHASRYAKIVRALAERQIPLPNFENPEELRKLMDLVYFFSKGQLVCR